MSTAQRSLHISTRFEGHTRLVMPVLAKRKATSETRLERVVERTFRPVAKKVERVLSDAAKRVAVLVAEKYAQRMLKGDLPGHEFHGNQWTGPIDEGAAMRYLGNLKQESELHKNFNEEQKKAGRAELSQAEFTALRAYLDNGYLRFNLPLRQGGFETFKNGQGTLKPFEAGTKKTENYINAVRLLNSAISKLPVHEGEVTRLVSLSHPDLKSQNELKSFLEAHREGKTITYQSFSSASSGTASDIKQASGGLFATEPNIELRINSKTGRATDLKYLSPHPGEKEVLFQSNTKFKVESVTVKPAALKSYGRLVDTYEIRLAEVTSAEKLAKDSTNVDIKRILAELKLSDVSAQVVHEITPELIEAFAKAGILGIGQVGIGYDKDMTNHVDQKAIDYAKARGAELVTKITDTTRDEMRDLVERGVTEGMSPQALANEVRESRSFSRERSIMIARTELAFAHVAGNLEGWRESNVVENKQWQASINCCPVCDLMDGEIVGLEEKFNFDGEQVDGPPGHPNCRCDVLPVLIPEGAKQ